MMKPYFFSPIVLFSLTIFGTSITAHAIAPAPALDNTAYILMDYDTGAVLAQKNADTPLPPASLTKMMTSYILEQQLLSGDLKEDTPIKMSKTAWCRGSSTQSCMYVPLGEDARAIDILRGIIIQSGNDASVAFAEYLSGSETAFASVMNDEAAKLGMTNTTFKNATGMPADGHLASAKDLATLARAIIKNSEQYYAIYAEKEFTYNNIKQQNRNILLHTDPTVDGLKTGHTSEAGYLLAASSNRNNLRLIAIVMGAKSMDDRANQMRELLGYGYGNFSNTILATKGQSIAKAPVKFGQIKEVDAVALHDLKVLTNKDNKATPSTIIRLNDNITAPIKQGQELGQILAMVDGKEVAKTPIVAASDVAQVGLFSRIWQSVIDWFASLF
ncbi:MULTISPECIES: D-alanyl-D-alanine carboxypeptidase family protein [unclassified Moraxella]|uniref:D-alanyl-D-alanine carboxypeptidase family protein n=1 Tax=unclassified Moraxella TaxID=2685852 RepID=UPI002B40622B|nr:MULTISPECIES: D-alanyl-D-alanine carboxypeptidase family protein [unclassified Moraxella]